MRFCPRCRSRFVSGSAKCPDCNILLLSVIPGGHPRSGAPDGEDTGFDPETGPSSPPKLLLLHEESLPEMAAMIKEFLQNCGIDCIVHCESIGLLYRLPGPGAPISRARLYVRDSDYHEARELVTNFFKKN